MSVSVALNKGLHSDRPEGQPLQASRVTPCARHYRMSCWIGLGLELLQSLLDLCGIHLHRTLLRWGLRSRIQRGFPLGVVTN
jgi:hypothetical protein